MLNKSEFLREGEHVAKICSRLPQPGPQKVLVFLPIWWNQGAARLRLCAIPDSPVFFPTGR